MTLRTPISGLSKLQREILRCLLANYRHVEEHGNDYCRLDLQRVGIRLLQFRPQYTSPSERAAFSRSLKRMEERGLILRTNHMSGVPGCGRIRTRREERHGRTDHVAFTAEGRELAERLT